MEKQILYLINGINYVLVSTPITSEYMRLKMVDRMKKHKGILQQATPKGSFWSRTYVQIDILIPESNLYDFNMEGMR